MHARNEHQHREADLGQERRRRLLRVEPAEAAVPDHHTGGELRPPPRERARVAPTKAAALPNRPERSGQGHRNSRLQFRPIPPPTANPRPVDTEKVTATFKAGALELHARKAEVAAPKKIHANSEWTSRPARAPRWSTVARVGRLDVFCEGRPRSAAARLKARDPISSLPTRSWSYPRSGVAGRYGRAFRPTRVGPLLPLAMSFTMSAKSPRIGAFRASLRPRRSAFGGQPGGRYRERATRRTAATTVSRGGWFLSLIARDLTHSVGSCCMSKRGSCGPASSRNGGYSGS